MTTTHVHDHGFPTAVDGLPACGPSTVVELGDGDSYDLRIAPVVNELGDARVRMLAYNGSIPGPTLRVDRRHRARGHRTRSVDGALPHRRAQPERDDVQLPRRPDVSHATRSDRPARYPGRP